MNENQLIFDIGMHIGADTDFYLRKGFRVIGIEANPDLAARCQQRFRSEGDAGQLVILNVAVSNQVGRIELFLDEENDLFGTTDTTWRDRSRASGHGIKTISVRSTTMKNILLEYGIPYYMKVDVEGSDALCLQGLLEFRERPKYVSVEASATSLEETQSQLRLLSRLGYDKFKAILQNEVHEQICPNPTREGLYVDHVFGASTSGLFGRDLPGEWMTFEKAMNFYRAFYFKVRMIGPHTGLFRSVRNRYLKSALGRIFHPGAGWYDTHATR